MIQGLGTDEILLECYKQNLFDLAGFSAYAKSPGSLKNLSVYKSVVQKKKDTIEE